MQAHVNEGNVSCLPTSFKPSVCVCVGLLVNIPGYKVHTHLLGLSAKHILKKQNGIHMLKIWAPTAL